MSDKGGLSAREALEREQARLLEEAAAKKAAADAIARDLAELDRLAAKYKLVVSAPGNDVRPAADGSVASLVRRYREDEKYQNLRYATRTYYDTLIKRILEDCGEDQLSNLNRQAIQRLYDRWSERGKSIAHSLVTMLRGLFNFGAATLNDERCEQLVAMMHNMRFKVAERRSERLTEQHVIAIRELAKKCGLRSVALAQAFQFDCMLRQKDVIGEWMPQSEPGISDTLNKDEKWLRGLRWEEIDEHLVLRHMPSIGNKLVEVDLKSCRMVMEELTKLEEYVGARPTRGPIIICESTMRPWTADAYRNIWRKIATHAGVPKGVKNMDSRPRMGSERAVEKNKRMAAP